MAARKQPVDLVLTPPALTEEQEQIDLFNEVADRLEEFPLLRWLFHVPNGGWRAIKTAVKMRLCGVKPGVLDMFLPVMRTMPDGSVSGGLWIELKRNTKDSRLSDYQKEWVRYLREAGYAVAVCKGCKVALNILLWYVALPPVVVREHRSTDDAVAAKGQENAV